MSTKRFLFSAITLVLSAILAMPAAAQSLTSGDITGGVTDPTGAVVADATVTAKNAETGTTQTQNTNAQGAYRFSLLSPGTYTVSASAKNFQSTQRQTTVSIGQASTLSFQLTLGTTEQIVEVTAKAAPFNRKMRICPQPSARIRLRSFLTPGTISATLCRPRQAQ